MAQNLKINNKDYNGVSIIAAPNANGGTAKFYDTSNASADASDIAAGKTAYVAGGKVTGTGGGGGGTLGTKTITSNGTYDASDDGYDGYSQVTANVPASAVDSGTKSITTNGTHDVIGYASANVAVPASAVDTGTKSISTNGTHDVIGYANASVSVPASAVDSGTKSITSNGSGQDVIGYAAVDVNVPNTYSASDEGKVVSSGALVAQTSDTVTVNDTYDTTLINSLTVNVSGGGGTWHKDDDKTHLYIDIPNSVLCDVNLSFTQTISGGHTIDWGDNTTPTTPTSTSTSLISHTYAQAGEYEIVITNTSGYFSLGDTSTLKGYIFQETGGNTQHDRYYARPAMLKKMELGKGWDCSKNRQFNNCRQLTEVYVNKKPDQTSFGAYLFEQCRKLVSITGVNGWDAGITSCGTNTFSNCPFDVSYIPSNLTAIPNNYMTQGSTSYSASALKLDLTGVQTIGTSAFSYLLISELDIPSSVTQIGASAFNSCNSLQVIHLRRSTPPTLDNANAFSITSASAHSCVMYVPRGKLTDYQTASNWSTFASYMQEEPS